MKELKKFADQLIAEKHWNVSCDYEIVEEAGAPARTIKHLSFSYPKIETDFVEPDEDEVDTGEDEFEDATEGEELCSPEEMVAYIKKAMDQFGGAGPDGADVRIVADPDTGDLIITCHKIETESSSPEADKAKHTCGGCCKTSNDRAKDKEEMVKSFVEGMEAALKSSLSDRRRAWGAINTSLFED